MTEALERSIGRLEGKVDGLKETVGTIDDKVTKLTAESNRRKGGWRVIVGASSVAGLIGGFVAKHWPFS